MSELALLPIALWTLFAACLLAYRLLQRTRRRRAWELSITRPSDSLLSHELRRVSQEEGKR